MASLRLVSGLRSINRVTIVNFHSQDIAKLHSTVRLNPPSYCNSLLDVNSTLVWQQRSVGSFLNHVSAQDLWKGVTGVSNSGKKKGRGKRVGRKRISDLNKGQVLGTGRSNILWPGLNAPIMKGKEIIQRRKLPPNPDREKELVQLRDESSRIRYPALPPLLRGWSGNKFPGQSVGPPDQVGDYNFKGFDSRVLEVKIVNNMTGTLGRKMTFTSFVCVGNGKGLAGYGQGKGSNARAAVRIAKNRAAQSLQFVELYEDHTVFHNMYNKYYSTKLFIHKKEKGYGLRCHRALKTACELIGIKDLHCKVEGSTGNVKCVVKGFFEALRKQETHQQLADRMKFHVVEQRKETLNYPAVIASPQDEKTRSDSLIDEDNDIEMQFDRLYYKGHVELKKRPRLPFYEYLQFPSWKKTAAMRHKRRGQEEARLKRQAGFC